MVAQKMSILASPPSEPKFFSLAEYLAKEEHAVHKHQFFNGQILRMPGAKSRHNLIATNITFAIKMAARAAAKNLLVYNSDQKIIIEQEEMVTVVYPDAMVICEKPVFWNGREDLITNPLVVVEVLSASTRKYDKGGKFLLYKKCPTLREYVTIEQMKPRIESWYRLSDTAWDNTFQEDVTKGFALRAIGISVELSDVYEYIEWKKM